MPGFNISNLSTNKFGPSNTVEVRRKHRWVFQTLGRGDTGFTSAELLLLQSASRPHIKFEQPEMHHNQEVVRFAGKQDWDPITLTWYDAEQDPDVSKGIYQWIETVVNLSDITVAAPKHYKKEATLAMVGGMATYSGGGASAGVTQISELWHLYGTWPADVNWQSLDYTASDLMTIEVVMRFDRAVRDCDAENVTVGKNEITCV